MASMKEDGVFVKDVGDGDGMNTAAIVEVGTTIGIVGVNVGVGRKAKVEVEEEEG